jgi:hypothetical protein
LFAILDGDACLIEELLRNILEQKVIDILLGGAEAAPEVVQLGGIRNNTFVREGFEATFFIAYICCGERRLVSEGIFRKKREGDTDNKTYVH